MLFKQAMSIIFEKDTKSERHATRFQQTKPLARFEHFLKPCLRVMLLAQAAADRIIAASGMKLGHYVTFKLKPYND
jgi:hypothetical protein